MEKKNQAAAEIRVGTCNWADHKAFYPEELEHGRRQRDKLSYYAAFFPVVEIDTTFYGIPTPRVVQGWVDRTPPGFLFDVKAFRSLTGHEREGGTPRPPTPEEERDFLSALAPLRDSGRLAAVCYQFPPWFTNRPDSRERLLEVRERHPDDIVAVEFRHRSWFDGDALPQTEELLRELDTVLVGVDAPQIGSGTAPPHMAITSPRLCIARFHGRNWRTWYKRVQTTAERFDFLYKPAQLQSWTAAIEAAADQGVPVHVLLNNNASNYAVVNAFDMAQLLGLSPRKPPRQVRETMRERDGRVPAWVESAPEPPLSSGEGEGGAQLSLTV
ncbi:MAG: DUF72 domain-containing protein [Candidatus Dormibacteraeota bacterium]|nr:DUF72 domain-containing protein [Candidatus Dormibacteraeota bacterium]